LKYLLNINVFKSSFIIFFILTALNSYNNLEFFIQTGSLGWLGFIAVVIIMSLYLGLNLFSNVKDVRLQIQITSYFFLTGLTQIIIAFFQYFSDHYNFENNLKMWFMVVYIGLFLLGLLFNKRYDVLASLKKKKSYWKEINTKTIVFTILMQIYIINPVYFNNKSTVIVNLILEYQPFRAIKSIIEAGPSLDYLRSHDNKTE